MENDVIQELKELKRLGVRVTDKAFALVKDSIADGEYASVQEIADMCLSCQDIGV